MGLTADVGPGPVALDTAAFIYVIEEDPRFLAELLPLFAAADAEARVIVTSAVTLLEVLVVPYRTGNRKLARAYEDLLTTSRGIRLVDLTRDQLRAAAQLRGATGMKTPDALQIAAALASGCGTFVTNDRRMPVVPGLRILQLSTYGPPAA